MATGIKMGIGKRLAIVFLILAGISMIIFSLFLRTVQANVPDALMLPASGLSQSVFEQQKSGYVADPSGYPLTYAYEKSGYLLDVANYEQAVVNKSLFQKLGNGFLLYAAEAETAEISRKVLGDVVTVLDSGSDTSLTAGELLYGDSGYLYGMQLTYMVYQITYGRSLASLNREYMVAYMMDVPDTGQTLIMSVMTPVCSTETLATAANYCRRELTKLRKAE